MIYFETLDHSLMLAGLDVDPAELQGGLAGLVSGGRRLQAGEMPAFFAQLTELPADQFVPVQDVLTALQEQTLEQLNTSEALLELMLPDDDEPLSVRVLGVCHWCRSYLAGLGHSGLSGETALAPDVSEAMRDLATIALVDPDGEGRDDDEASYAELVEFIRVAVSLIHTELHHLMHGSDRVRH